MASCLFVDGSQGDMNAACLQEKLDAYKSQIDELSNQVQQLLAEKRAQPKATGAPTSMALSLPSVSYHTTLGADNVGPSCICLSAFTGY